MISKESIITGAILILITYTLGLSLVGQAFPAAQTSKTLSSTGTIQTIGVGVYTTSECSTPVTAIPWGTLEPGASQNFVCYIKNEGSSPTTLSLETDYWVPTVAASYLDLDWDYDNQPINSGASIPVTFTLTVDANIEGITTFSFDITIVGTS